MKHGQVTAKTAAIIRKFNTDFNRRTRSIEAVYFALEQKKWPLQKIAEYFGRSIDAVKHTRKKARVRYIPHDAPALEKRRPECRHYNRCLTAAAMKNLPRVGCETCRRFVPDADQMADPLLLVADYCDDDAARMPDCK